jgi:hypothetical protein
MKETGVMAVASSLLPRGPLPFGSFDLPTGCHDRDMDNDAPIAAAAEPNAVATTEGGKDNRPQSPKRAPVTAQQVPVVGEEAQQKLRRAENAKRAGEIPTPPRMPRTPVAPMALAHEIYSAPIT